MEELLQQQNKLLEQMNLLLQNQNLLLTRNTKTGGGNYIFENEFVENLYGDEMRNGFLVTSHRKKLWNAQIGLINEFARICKKHNLRWFAYAGTMLGAVRHKGFIPWDDDVDLMMFRPDYEKFKQVAKTELKYPYYLDKWYDYRLKGEEDLLPVDVSLPLIEPGIGGWPMVNFLKLRDSRTLLLEYPDRNNVHQGIWIDIFPLNYMPPFADESQNGIFAAICQLFAATVNPQSAREALKNNVPLVISRKELEKFVNLPYSERGLLFDKVALDNFAAESKYVGQYQYHVWNMPRKYEAEDFAETIYMPFEKIEIPVPIGYEKILTNDYGDWRKFVITHSHAKDYSADISYEEYFKLLNTDN